MSPNKSIETPLIALTHKLMAAYQNLYLTARNLVEFTDRTPDESLVNTDNIEDLDSACKDVYLENEKRAVPVDGKNLMLEMDTMRPEDPIFLYKALLNYDGPDMMPDWPADKQKDLTKSLNKLRYSLLGRIISDGNVTEINRPVLTWGVDLQKGGLKVLSKSKEPLQ